MIQSAVLYVLSAVTPPHEYVEDILNHFVNAIKSSTVCVSTICVNFLAVLTRGAVVEDQAECITYPRGFLLQEPVEYFEFWSHTGHGSVIGLPWRRERGSEGDGVQGTLRDSQVLAKTEYHPTQGE